MNVKKKLVVCILTISLIMQSQYYSIVTADDSKNNKQIKIEASLERNKNELNNNEQNIDSKDSSDQAVITNSYYMQQKNMIDSMNDLQITTTIPKDAMSFNMTHQLKTHLYEELKKLASSHNIGSGITNTYTIEEALDLLIDKLDNQMSDLDQSVPKEMIAAVLFREIICYDVFDKYGDGNWAKTMGISQISVQGVRFNDYIISNKENGIPEHLKISDDEIGEMLEDDFYNVDFAADALKARAYINDIDLSTTSQSEIEQIFAEYNGYEGQIPFISEMACKLGLDIRMPEIGLVQYKDTYGIQTYQYYEQFKAYYDAIGKIHM